jgi:hypothetical protein
MTRGGKQNHRTTNKEKRPMASELKKINSAPIPLDPGQSLTTHWNNANQKAVYSIQAIPLESSFPGVSGPATVEVEVTRVWRKLNVTKTTSDVQPFTFEHEIWYVVKNPGTKKVTCDVYAGIVS